MSFRLEVLREAVRWAETLEDYGVKATIRLDDKAQQTAGLAGLFLAAAFGFLKPDSFSSLGIRTRYWVVGFLLVVIVDLISCVAACLSVTWLRYVPTPLNLRTLRRMLGDVLDLKAYALTVAVQENVYEDRLTVWQDIIDERTELNKVKARRLRRAQLLLASGIVLSSALLMIAISANIHLRSH